MGNAQLKEREIEAFKQIKKIIDEKVCVKLSKGNGLALNAAQIEKECKLAVFKELETALKTQLEFVHQFFALLSSDNPDLYTGMKSRAEASGLAELIKAKKFAEIRDMQQALFNAEELDALYSQGFKWFQEKNFEKAFLYFAFLSLVDSDNANNWMMKGQTEYHLQKYEDALQSYRLSITCDPTIISVYIYIMNCLILTGRIDAARQAYEELNKEIDFNAFTNSEELKEKLNMIKQFI